MLRPLKISTSGVRGIVGESFNPALAARFAWAFGTYIEGGRCAVSRDTRPSGEMITYAVTSGLLAAGCQVIDLGICPTAALQLYVRESQCAGGLAVTAGHNPQEWNALKFIGPRGQLLRARQGEELLEIFHLVGFLRADWSQLKPVEPFPDAAEKHRHHLLNSFSRDAIAAAKLKVALDCCNGACSLSTPTLLEELGCEVVAINTQPGLPFPHSPEPKPQNLAQLAVLTRAAGADIGFAQDADGDRLGLVDEQGRAPGEEYTFCIAADYALKAQPGTVVTNFSTTAALEDIAAAHRSKLLRVRVGQSFIAQACEEEKAVIGGEGSGGIMLPKVGLFHDSTAVLCHILEYIATTGAKASELIAQVPKWSIAKEDLALAPAQVYAVMQQLRETVHSPAFAQATVNLEDGVRLAWPDAWVHIRPSDTEQLLRIIAEARDAGRTQELMDDFRRRVLMLL